MAAQPTASACAPTPLLVALAPLREPAARLDLWCRASICRRVSTGGQGTAQPCSTARGSRSGEAALGELSPCLLPSARPAFAATCVALGEMTLSAPYSIRLPATARLWLPFNAGCIQRAWAHHVLDIQRPPSTIPCGPEHRQPGRVDAFPRRSGRVAVRNDRQCDRHGARNRPSCVPHTTGAVWRRICFRKRKLQRRAAPGARRQCTWLLLWRGNHQPRRRRQNRRW